MDVDFTGCIADSLCEWSNDGWMLISLLGNDVGEESFGASTGRRAVISHFLPDARWH